MRHILTATSHRPWPLPRRPWVMAMEWHDLLFMHWPVRPELLRPRIPPALELETWEGYAWLGVVPFMMRGVRPRLTPAVPGLSAFPELNVRTYVSRNGVPGVWFFSLDAASRLAVRGARYGFHLPYMDARMACERAGDAVRYRSQRTHRDAPPAALRATYRPTGPAYQSAPGGIEHWLTERYCLYAANRRGDTWRGDIHHTPWLLQPAEVELEQSRMADQLQLLLPPAPPLVHFARRLDVAAWALASA
ncbi:DUF2071 domain-containing protein [Oscillochloris sp. ZM17-4]|uniref:YqjF family protein n=1 Tax=Oscillochloris sp. ZM17-4 TaxID=2866714 RepID=UPI001C72A9E7|nr:DUF2071 domain-containing protein [Oscillochloris sp. ZM17-4]MBX0326646.1 DUF2071 domain-containing protein [Oscillochloris sp. ZM17-4]